MGAEIEFLNSTRSKQVLTEKAVSPKQQVALAEEGDQKMQSKFSQQLLLNQKLKNEAAEAKQEMTEKVKQFQKKIDLLQTQNDGHEHSKKEKCKGIHLETGFEAKVNEQENQISEANLQVAKRQQQIQVLQAEAKELLKELSSLKKQKVN